MQNDADTEDFDANTDKEDVDAESCWQQYAEADTKELQ